jgi:hypothetical protein
MTGVFRYDRVALTRSKLFEHADSLTLVSSEPCAPVGLGPKSSAEAGGVQLDGEASPIQCSPVGTTISSAPKPKPLKFYNRKSKDSRFSKMDDSLITEAVSVFNAPPDESSSAEPAPLLLFVKIAGQTSPEVAHDPVIRVLLSRIPLRRGVFYGGGFSTRVPLLQHMLFA